METVWTVEGDGRFFAEKPVLSFNVVGESLTTNSPYFLVIKLSPRSSSEKLEIIDNPKLYLQKLFFACGMLFRVQDYERWNANLSVEFTEVWNPIQ